jgi:hypothetical protein
MIFAKDLAASFFSATFNILSIVSNRQQVILIRTVNNLWRIENRKKKEEEKEKLEENKLFFDA